MSTFKSQPFVRVAQAPQDIDAQFWDVYERVLCLSKREVDVLRWTAMGKTAWEVGVLMSLTERTINFHISRVVDKLGVPNKTAAAVLAVRAGRI